MKNLSINIGLATILAVLPIVAQAAPYCGERVCHSYDRDGSCNNYTCFGGGSGYGNSNNYGNQYSNYTNRNTSRCSYYNGVGGSTYSTSYNTGCYNNQYNNGRYNNNQYYDNRYYRDSSNSGTRRYDRAYYYDEYDTGYNDRFYVPKAGYYYRY
ncbi:hypothetical protein KKF55_06495 [Patescibacteria group bacterium]|nr:hypothetical protein [Patescibacteria group bacterium]